MAIEPIRQGHLTTRMVVDATEPLAISPRLPTEELRVIEWDHLNLFQFYPMAVSSTWTVRTCLYPLSVLRARMQLQKQTTVYRSTWHAFTNIIKHEGFTGLYRGFWVTVPQIGTSFIYSTVYEKLRAVLQYDYGVQSVPLISCIAGGAAAFCSQVIFVPTDIVAQHMMIYNYADKFVSGNDKAIIDHLRSGQSTGTLGIRTLKAVYRIDGLSGFYRGFFASSMVYVPTCLVFWPTYYEAQFFLKALKEQVINLNHSYLLLDQAIAATFSGLVSTVATNPMEIYRIRLQVHRTDYGETLSRMIRNEGWSLLWKGLPPRLISNSIYSGVVMVGYEMVKRFSILPEYKQAVTW